MLSWLPTGTDPTGYGGAAFDRSRPSLFAQLLADPDRFAPLNWLVVAEPLGPDTGDALRSMPHEVHALVLTAGVGKVDLVPRWARRVVIAGSDTYYTAKNASATLPAGDVTDGSASEMNGGGGALQPGGPAADVTTIGVIAPRDCIVTLAYYYLDAALFLSADVFVTGGDEVPADRWFEPRLAAPVFRYARSARGLGGLVGEAGASFGTMPIANGDRGLDGYLPPAYAWDGRPLSVYMGGRGFRFDDYGRVATLQARALTATPAGMEIVIDDLDRPLEQAVMADTYGGAGGLDGGAELAGQVHPYGAGICRQVEPVLIDASTNTYEFNGVRSDALTAVRVSGAAVTAGTEVSDITAATPSAGTYAWEIDGDSGRSYFRLGTTPTGVVTCDFRGDATGDGYVSLPGAVLRRALERLETPPPLDLGSFVALDTRAPYPIGFYARERSTARDLLDRTMLSLFGFWGRRRTGALAVDILRPPGSPVASFDESGILAIDRLEAPAPIRALRYGYRPRWRPLTAGEVVDAAAADRPDQIVTNSWSSERRDPSIAVRHPLSESLSLADGLLDDGDDADDVRDRIWDMLATSRSLFRVTLRAQPFVRELGETIRITSNRAGLPDGGLFRIVGIDEQAGPPRVQVDVWG